VNPVREFHLRTKGGGGDQTWPEGGGKIITVTKKKKKTTPRFYKKKTRGDLEKNGKKPLSGGKTRKPQGPNNFLK